MPVTRLTLTLTAAPAMPGLALLGARLAAQLGVSLEVMLYEERNLLGLAELSLLRRIRWPSGVDEALTASDLETELRAHETQLRHAVAAAARAAGVESSFQVVSEAAETGQVAMDDAIVVVPQAALLGHRREIVRGLLGRVAGMLLLPHGTTRLDRAAVLVGPDSRGAFLSSALEFVRLVGGERTVDLVVHDASTEAAQRAVRTALGVAQPALRVHRLAGAGRLERWPDFVPGGIDALIVSARDLPTGAESIDFILRESSRPLLVVRDD